MKCADCILPALHPTAVSLSIFMIFRRTIKNPWIICCYQQLLYNISCFLYALAPCNNSLHHLDRLRPFSLSWAFSTSIQALLLPFFTAFLLWLTFVTWHPLPLVVYISL
eukprot:scaffold735_cov116-Cylindrotheca_fusiformis.AAC.24